MSNNLKPLPTGPNGTFLGGSAEDYKANPLSFLMRCKREHGDVVPFRVGLYPVLFVNDPDLIQTILVADAANYTKDTALRNNPGFFGNGLLSSEGDYWKRQRKMAAPAFSPRRLEEYGKIMVEHTEKMLDQWQDGKTVDVQHEMMQLTLRVVAKTLFDAEVSVDKELEEALTLAQKYLADRMNDPLVLMFPEWVPFPTNILLNDAIQTIEKVVYKLIDERRKDAEGRHDLLSVFLSIKDETDGTEMSDKQIRDEVFTLFFAGHETTALTLTWTLYLLSQFPAVEEKLLAEVKEVLNGRRPTVADYSALSYIEKVVKESMRILPPVWSIGREAVNDCALGDYAVPKGTAIIMSQWVMHRDERYYNDPNKFDPDRWSEEFTRALPKFAYFPFGGGPRVCIGNGFAMMEAVLMLASIMQDFSLSLAPGDLVELMPAVTLRPAEGIKMTLHKR